MAITNQQAIQSIKDFGRLYMDNHQGQIEFTLGLYNHYINDTILQSSVESALEIAMENFFGVAYEYKYYPDFTYKGDRVEILNDAKPENLVEMLFPNSPDKASLINAIKSGSISPVDLGMGAALEANKGASIDNILDSIGQATGTVPYVPVSYAEAHLPFEGVSKQTIDLVTAMYISSFNRAPDHEGLKFWSNEVKHFQGLGFSLDNAILEVGKNLYKGGEINGEGGTSLSTSMFVEFAYTNTLGRKSDTEGLKFWAKEIDSGVITRGEFVTKFLIGALGGKGADAQYVEARIAVAKHAAQEHVSGPKVANPINLGKVLVGIDSPAKAQAAINKIIADFGHALKKMAFSADSFDGEVGALFAKATVEKEGAVGDDSQIVAITTVGMQHSADDGLIVI